MKIQVTKEGTTLTLKPEGHLDTLTAPELNRCVQAEIKGVKTIIMDMEQVGYISSAGLRIMLATEQAMEDCGGTMSVIHCNDAIAEVLEMTGFMDMLNVK